MAIEILGYTAAIIIGIVLGLTGGGGSILTVPVFVYILCIDPVIATGYSLFVVGVASLFGAGKNIQKRKISYTSTIIFALPAVLSVFSTRKYIIPALPEIIYETPTFILTKDVAIMVFFGILMLASAVSMLCQQEKKITPNAIPDTSINIGLLGFLGLFTGFITAVVGAGGGFIIVPILVMFAKLPIKKAVATSLLIIAINSLIGFLGDVSTIKTDWSFLLLFTVVAVIGIFIGIYLNRFVDSKKLKKAFGWFVLLMGIYILLKELFLS